MVCAKIRKLMVFFEEQASTTAGTASFHLIPRNVFRALTVDIITAILFGEITGTAYLARLRCGPNHMGDLGMRDLELWFEDTREGFFIIEPGAQLRWGGYLISKTGSAHSRFERDVLQVMEAFENLAANAPILDTDQPDKIPLYARLLEWEDPETGAAMSREERAAEVMDHMGKIPPSQMKSSMAR